MSKKSDCGIEGLVGCALGIEECLVKVPLREASVNLPVSKGVQDFYYNNTGDFMSGYIGALWTDIILTQASEKLYSWSCDNLEEGGVVRGLIESVYEKTDFFSYVGGIVASVVVALEEIYGFTSHPDLMDIPMGITGALTYVGTRKAMNVYRKKQESNLLEEELVFDR